MKSRGVNDDEFKNVDSGNPPIWIPEGIYPAQLVDVEITSTPWGEKLVFSWKVFTSPDFRGAEMRDERTVSLRGYYNIKRDKGKRFIFGPHSAYYKDWIAANNGKHPEPRNSLPLSVFKDRLQLVQVTTVTKDTRGSLHSSCHWSKVQRIIRPLDEDEIIKRLPLQLNDIA